jgi:hypothetical protein
MQKKKNDFFEKHENGYESNGVMFGVEISEKKNHEKTFYVLYDSE